MYDEQLQLIDREGPFDVTAVFVGILGDDQYRLTIRVQTECKYDAGAVIRSITGPMGEMGSLGPWGGWFDGRCWCKRCGGPPPPLEGA